MLALKIIATVFMALSCITAWIKNTNIWCSSSDTPISVGVTIYGWIWRAFIIVVIWLL